MPAPAKAAVVVGLLVNELIIHILELSLNSPQDL
jgi:hypothetical protein